MKHPAIRRLVCFSFIFIISLIFAPNLSDLQAQERPPEYLEFLKAMRIEDLNARLKELERIKAAHPSSPIVTRIEFAILVTKIELCSTLDCIIELQKLLLEKEVGFRRLYLYYLLSQNILKHKNIGRFDKKRVSEAVLGHANDGLKLAADTELIKTFPPEQQEYVKRLRVEFYLVGAQAHLHEEKPIQALEKLDDFKKSGGRPDATYYYYLGEAYAKLGRDKEALTAYFEAAAEDYESAAQKAKSLYQKINKSSEGFEAKLDAKIRELPFQPEKFKPRSDWKGKVVLVELFTGSECPPCIASDLGFDGLIDAYSSRYVAILEYHLPIPAPDPMMNPATQKRQDYYEVESTPDTFFDGEKKYAGGGGKTVAQEKFEQYDKEIKSKIYMAPQIHLKVSAVLDQGTVKINYSFDKTLNDADYNLVLVQKEEKYRGSNRIVFHKMVVREFLTVSPHASSGQAALNLDELEKAAEKYLADFEKTRTFNFKEKHFKIDRSGLKVIFFVQDKKSKIVYNASVSDVR